MYSPISIEITVKYGYVDAVRPWRSIYREDRCCKYDLQKNQAQINHCMVCQLAADCCDRCDGTGHLARQRGRPRKTIA